MARENRLGLSQAIVIIGGFIALLYSFYYMQRLSYSIGVYSGISRTITAYNITNHTAAEALIGSISQTTTLALALNLTYVLLPFAVLIFAIGTLWLFSRQYSKLTATMLIISSIIYLILVGILELDFSFGSVLSTFPIAYVAGALALAGGSYSLYSSNYRQSPQQKRIAPTIVINPERPYSNMRMLSTRLMGRLNGTIKILDMHFDVNSLDNLMQLIERHADRYTSIQVLTSSMRLGAEFGKSYTDFKNELSNKRVDFELRVLEQTEAAKQHERLILDDSIAYKIPPINIINKKSEHIVGINHHEAESKFSTLWPKATKYENLK
ncbi:MAG: hypothetical protein KGI06_02035 [Candidatus Micrarchaeota archaeon]|nr:hypothetical protein [Candidatus Micrarchaeota archaeon]